MSNTTTTPAVYVGTYHKYNCGSIFGKWFDLTEFDGREDFYEAGQALHADEWDADFMFQDQEGIPSQFVSESSIDWDFIAAYKRVEEGRRGQGSRFYRLGGVYRRSQIQISLPYPLSSTHPGCGSQKGKPLTIYAPRRMALRFIVRAALYSGP